MLFACTLSFPSVVTSTQKTAVMIAMMILYAWAFILGSQMICLLRPLEEECPNVWQGWGVHVAGNVHACMHDGIVR